MDVCDQLPEISILFTKDRFVAVLEKVSVAAMPPVDPHRIAGQKPPNDRCYRMGSGAQKQMLWSSAPMRNRAFPSPAADCIAVRENFSGLCHPQKSLSFRFLG